MARCLYAKFKSTVIRIEVIVLVCLLAAACAPRQVTPVQISRSGDDSLGCSQVLAEYEGNQNAAIALVGEKRVTTKQNYAAGTVGILLVWPALFALDLSQAEQVQIRSLQDRNANLERIATAQGCPMTAEQVDEG